MNSISATSSFVISTPTSSLEEESETTCSISPDDENSIPEVIIISKATIPIPSSKSEVEESLKVLLKKIRKETKEFVSSKKFVGLTARVFLQISRDDRLLTALKCSAMVLAIGSLHPTFIGSIACLMGYKVENYTDLYSSDLNTTTNASILFSNTGQGISFLMQAVELAIMPSFLLFKNVYDRAMCQALDNIYRKHIFSLQNEDAKRYLYEEANHELSHWGGWMAETEEVNTVMKQIAQDKKEKLSYWNIFGMTCDRFFRKAKNFPLATMAKTSLIGVTALALHPLVVGLMGCLDSYRVGNTNDLYSADLIVRANAVNIFSNTGHIVEYSLAGLGLLAGTATLLFDYKKSMHKIIKDIYESRMQRPSLSEHTQDFLRDKKRHDLASYK